MKECPNLDRNRKWCACTYEGCDKIGMCCECIAYHRKMKQIPGCFFNKEGEATYDRSIAQFKKYHL